MVDINLVNVIIFQVIYGYLKPEKLPEHDDVKTLSITADCENFMKRVVALIPDNVAIHKRRTTAEEVIQGKKVKPKVKKYKKLPLQMNDLFYSLLIMHSKIPWICIG